MAEMHACSYDRLDSKQIVMALFSALNRTSFADCSKAERRLGLRARPTGIETGLSTDSRDRRTAMNRDQ